MYEEMASLRLNCGRNRLTDPFSVRTPSRTLRKAGASFHMKKQNRRDPIKVMLVWTIILGVLAAGAIKAFHKHSLQQSVIGFDNTILCECLTPSLTSVDLHMEKACDTAIQILDQLLEKKPCKQLHTCPAEIIWRESFVK